MDDVSFWWQAFHLLLAIALTWNVIDACYERGSYWKFWVAINLPFAVMQIAWCTTFYLANTNS